MDKMDEEELIDGGGVFLPMRSTFRPFKDYDTIY